MIANIRVHIVLGLLVLVSLSFSSPSKLESPSARFFLKYLDLDGDARLSIEELTTHKVTGSKNLMKIERLMKLLDTDRSGFVEYNEFADHVKDPIEGGPQQIHLALTTLPSEMVVMWITRDLYQASLVQYGLSSGSYSNSQNATYTTYNVGLDGWNGWVYTSILTGLTPATKYYYICGDPASQTFSQEYSFITAPQTPVSPQAEYIFPIVADMGTYIPMGWAVTDQIVNDMSSYQFSMVLHPGDICYAGTGSDWEIEEVWDVWENQVQPLASSVPYMFAVGNHEHYYNFTSYLTRFLMPGEQSGGNSNFWWSIDFGNTHFIAMSTEHPYQAGSPQYIWLQQDLAKAVANRENVPWIIVSGHRPMYNTDVDEWDAHRPGAYFQSIIEPLFVQYNVDLYLSGHMHMYERIHPNINGTVVQSGNVYIYPKATAHVVQATAGVFTDSDYIQPQPDWSAARNDYWGYGRMTVNGTHLHYEFLHQEDNSVNDEFWIIKD